MAYVFFFSKENVFVILRCSTVLHEGKEMFIKNLFLYKIITKTTVNFLPQVGFLMLQVVFSTLHFRLFLHSFSQYELLPQRCIPIVFQSLVFPCASISFFNSLCIAPISWIGGCFEEIKVRALTLANSQVLKHDGYICWDTREKLTGEK